MMTTTQIEYLGIHMAKFLSHNSAWERTVSLSPRFSTFKSHKACYEYNREILNLFDFFNNDYTFFFYKFLDT